MYYVIQTTSCDEPWWMTTGWEANVEQYAVYSQFVHAKNQYIDWFNQLNTQYPKVKTKEPYMAAFYKEGEYYYCEDCGDDLQTYHGLLILDATNRQIDPKIFGDKTQAICVNCPINRK